MMINVYIDRKKWKQIFNWPMAITLLATALITRSLYLALFGEHYIFLSFSICTILLAIVVQKKIEKRRKVQEMEAIKIFAETKAKEAGRRIEYLLKIQSRGAPDLGEISAVQRSFIAYTSILDVINGDDPVDAIHNPDE
jgi:hypothetical protein